MTAVKNEKNKSKYKSRLQKTNKKDFFKGIIQNILLLYQELMDHHN